MNIIISAFMALAAFISSGPYLEFTSNRIVNYGDIQSGKTATVLVSVLNSGDEDLVIFSDYRTCNCTSVKYPNRVMEPGDKQIIRLDIDTSGRIGKETIVVKLLTNAQDKYSVIRVDINIISKPNK